MPETPDWPLSRRLAVIYSPASERPVLEALVEVESQIAASLRERLDHHVAHIRLQWWREECARLAKGHPAPPLTRTLLTAFSNGPTAALEGVCGLVDAATWDLATATFETRRELTAYCERWATAMIVPAAAHAVPGSESWLALGASMRELEMLAQLAPEA